MGNKLDNEVQPRSHPIVKGGPRSNEVINDIEEGPTFVAVGWRRAELFSDSEKLSNRQSCRPPPAYDSKQDLFVPSDLGSWVQLPVHTGVCDNEPNYEGVTVTCPCYHGRVWCLGFLGSDRDGVGRWMLDLQVECWGPWPVLRLSCQFTAECLVAVLKMSSLLSFWQELRLSLVLFTKYSQLFSPLVEFYFPMYFKIECGHVTC